MKSFTNLKIEHSIKFNLYWHGNCHTLNPERNKVGVEVLDEELNIIKFLSAALICFRKKQNTSATAQARSVQINVLGDEIMIKTSNMRNVAKTKL